MLNGKQSRLFKETLRRLRGWKESGRMKLNWKIFERLDSIASNSKKSSSRFKCRILRYKQLLTCVKAEEEVNNNLKTTTKAMDWQQILD